MKQNDDSLLDFKHDIESVPAAEGVILDGLQGDAKDLLAEVTLVRETAKNEADRLEKEGKITRMSLAEIKEQKTQVRLISGLPHYNKIEHITGRTQMERFAARATAIVEGTVSALDDLKKTYAGVLTYFGEDEKMPSNEFFGTMKKFALEFQASAEQVEKDEKAKVRGALCSLLCQFSVLLTHGDIHYHSSKRTYVKQPRKLFESVGLLQSCCLSGG